METVITEQAEAAQAAQATGAETPGTSPEATAARNPSDGAGVDFNPETATDEELEAYSARVEEQSRRELGYEEEPETPANRSTPEPESEADEPAAEPEKAKQEEPEAKEEQEEEPDSPFSKRFRVKDEQEAADVAAARANGLSLREYYTRMNQAPSTQAEAESETEPEADPISDLEAQIKDTESKADEAYDSGDDAGARKLERQIGDLKAQLAEARAESKFRAEREAERAQEAAKVRRAEILGPLQKQYPDAWKEGSEMQMAAQEEFEKLSQAVAESDEGVEVAITRAARRLNVKPATDPAPLPKKNPQDISQPTPPKKLTPPPVGEGNQPQPSTNIEIPDNPLDLLNDLSPDDQEKVLELAAAKGVDKFFETGFPASNAA